MKARYPSQKIVVGIEALGRLMLRTLYLRLFKPWRDRPHDTCSHLVLQLKDILQRTVEAVCPEMRARGHIDQLCGDPQPVGRLAHATFKHIAYPQFASDLLHVYRPAF